MRGKIVLAVVLCLVAAAALGIGAAPALAASGCTCHTAVPPTGGAPAVGAPLVVGLDCTTCHTDWTMPHPVSSPLWPRLTGRTVATGYQLEAWVGATRVVLPMTLVSVAHPGVVVYLQQRLWGAAEFTDLTHMTTGGDGKCSFTVPSPAPFAAYRGIAQGHVGALVGGGTALFEPGASVLLPKAVATLKLLGLRSGAVKLGSSVRVSGTVKPADIGGNVHFIVQSQRQSGGWQTRPRLWGKATISATGTYSWRFTPKGRGLWRVQVSTDGHSETTRAGSSPWGKVVVK